MFWVTTLNPETRRKTSTLLYSTNSVNPGLSFENQCKGWKQTTHALGRCRLSRWTMFSNPQAKPPTHLSYRPVNRPSRKPIQEPAGEECIVIKARMLMEKCLLSVGRIYRWFSFVERFVADRRGLAFVEFGCVFWGLLSVGKLNPSNTPFVTRGKANAGRSNWRMIAAFGAEKDNSSSNKT